VVALRCLAAGHNMVASRCPPLLAGNLAAESKST
jgi:hypothetical protein